MECWLFICVPLFIRCLQLFVVVQFICLWSGNERVRSGSVWGMCFIDSVATARYGI
jgi:hypothetical protein